MSNKSKLGFGILLGAAAGALAGLFLAPKSGVELRKDARRISQKALKTAEKYRNQLEGKEPEEIARIVFGNVSDQSVKLMKQAHKDLSVELALLNEKYKKIDKKKYTAAVKKVVSGLRKDGSVPEGSLKQLSEYLIKDTKKLASRTSKTTTKTARKTTKPKSS